MKQFKILKDMKIIYESKYYANSEMMEIDSVNHASNFTDDYYCIQIMSIWNNVNLELAEWICKQKKNDGSQEMTDKMCEYENKANCEVFPC